MFLDHAINLGQKNKGGISAAPAYTTFISVLPQYLHLRTRREFVELLEQAMKREETLSHLLTSVYFLTFSVALTASMTYMNRIHGSSCYYQKWTFRRF